MALIVAGFDVTGQSVRNRVANVALDGRRWLLQAQLLKQQIEPLRFGEGGVNELMVSLGLTQAQSDLNWAAVLQMDNLRQVAQNLLTVPNANNFFFEADKLIAATPIV
jgi:hypothetical protein